MPELRLDRHVPAESARAALESDVRAGLTSPPRTLPAKWFYDARGSQLFDEITRLPEYYQTRTERMILEQRADEIALISRADTLVELGSGTSEKTRVLLDAMAGGGALRRYVPFDVDESVLRTAGTDVARDYPGVEVHAIVGDFQLHLPLLPTGGRRLIAFLGGTIGNLVPDERAAFLTTLASGMGQDDMLLLGTDLVKDPDRLVRAYDDAAGVTAAFNRNVLHVLRRELGAVIDPDAFDHVAVWNDQQEWIEMRLRARHDQTVRVLDLELRFSRGEEIRTEVSAKFRHEGLLDELAHAGLVMRQWWTDPSGDYALSLSGRATA